MPSRPGLHHCEKTTNMEITVKLLRLSLAQRTGPSLRRQFVDAFLIRTRKLHREQISGDVWGNGARVGFDYPRKNRRFRIRGHNVRTHRVSCSHDAPCHSKKEI